MRTVFLPLVFVASIACSAIEQGMHEMRETPADGEPECEEDCIDTSLVDTDANGSAYYGTMIIENPEGLEGFCELYDAVWGNLRIEMDSTGYTNLDLLECLTLVDGEFVIEGSTVESIDLPYLVYVGDFLLSETSSLMSMTLPSLGETTGSFRMIGASSLSSADVASLRFTGETFELERTRLPNTGAFTGLSGVGTDFVLNGNDSLVSLSGFSGLNSIGGNFSVVNNDNLLDAEVQNLLESIGEENIGGEVDTSGNGGH
jgi:hypothetical protein